jgi:hypothetical protein
VLVASQRPFCRSDAIYQILKPERCSLSLIADGAPQRIGSGRRAAADQIR